MAVRLVAKREAELAYRKEEWLVVGLVLKRVVKMDVNLAAGLVGTLEY